MLLRLTYCSLSTLPAERMAQDVLDILARSRLRNPRWGVTGLLAFNAGCFLQCLEGPAPVVRGLFGRIRADPRHDRVVLLREGQLPDRLMPAWSMAFLGRGAGPGFTHEGLCAAGPDAADRVLHLLMRDVAEEPLPLAA